MEKVPDEELTIDASAGQKSGDEACICEPTNEAGGPEPKSPEEILRQELEQKQEEAKKYYDMHLRSLAEADNIRKRAQREKEEYIKFAHVSMIKKLLPVLDDLHRAINTAQKSQDFESLSKGVEMTAKNLTDLLRTEGLEGIECLGKPFDPQYHEPLTVEPSDAYPENTVIEELQKGYMLHDRVIRPSLVKVSGSPAE